jgi:CheY-like chemotaxis protein
MYTTKLQMTEPTEQQFPIKTILLIDDDPDDCYIFHVALGQISPSLKLAVSIGTRDFSDLLETCSPDLIFLDINMPALNGFDCLRSLKDNPRFSRIPVVMYSSSGMPIDINASFGLGATLYLKKASTVDSLVSALRKILSLDWVDPSQITSYFYFEGNYHSFTETVVD